MDSMTVACECWRDGTELCGVRSRRAAVVFPAGDARKRRLAASFLPASSAAARFLKRGSLFQAWLGIGITHLVACGGPANDYLGAVQADLDVGARDCVRIGTVGQVRSMIVRHLGKTDRPTAFSKIAIGEGGRIAVANEAQMLRRLGGHHAPRLLSCSDVGVVALTTAALEGKLLDYRQPCPDDLEDCLEHVGLVNRIYEHPWMKDLLAVGDDELVKKALEIADRMREWPVVHSHGDAAPWNAIRTPEGQLCLIDWEFGRHEGLWLFDRAFWCLQTARLVVRATPQAAARACCAHIANRFNHARTSVHGLVALVCIGAATRSPEATDCLLKGNGVRLSEPLWWRACAAAAVGIERDRRMA